MQVDHFACLRCSNIGRYFYILRINLVGRKIILELYTYVMYVYNICIYIFSYIFFNSSLMNPFSSEYFAWLDIGAIRHTWQAPSSKKLRPKYLKRLLCPSVRPSFLRSFFPFVPNIRFCNNLNFLITTSFCNTIRLEQLI